MSPLTQLGKSEIEARFHIVGQKAILFSLREFIARREQFSLYFNEGRESFLTCLLGTAPDGGDFFVDVSARPEMNARFLKSAQNVFVGRPGGVMVRFVAGKACQVKFERGDAFVLHLPQFIIRLQRREHFRITMSSTKPLVKPVPVTLGLPLKGGICSLPLHDLSLAGCGLAPASVPPALEGGCLLPDCRFVLPDADGTSIATSGLLCHRTPVAGRFRMGLQFGGLKPGLEHLVQRFIVQLERERRQRFK